MLKSWWERWPGRLEYDLEALEAAGIPFCLDENARQRRVICLKLAPTIEGEQFELIAVFPDLYPYIRFEVQAPGLELRSHQNPLAKNLCFIGRNTANWKVTDTLADFIKNRLPLVLQAARTKDRQIAESIEQHQGEPVSNYYVYEPGAMFMIESAWSLPSTLTSGQLLIGLPVNISAPLRGVVLEIRNPSGNILASANGKLRELYPKKIHGRWFRVERPAQENDPTRFLSSHTTQHRKIQNLGRQKLDGEQVDIVGIVFPEETEYRKTKDGWIFVVRPGGSKAYFARAGWSGREDLSLRVPEVASVHNKRVAVIGLGGIGGPSAIEFARSGVGELRLLDRDTVDPGNIVRWPLGFTAAGLPKSTAIKQFISVNYPYTNVIAHHHCIGNALNAGGPDLEIIDRLLDGVDLIYDATAELGLQCLCSDLGAERSIPYICVSTTHGAWGGLLARIRPGKTLGCWNCLQWNLSSSIPLPPAHKGGEIQPRGCGDPTFTGTGFDVSQVALAGVRLAIATLCQGINDGYPDFEWDVGVLALRDQEGRPIAPLWRTFPLSRHPKCPRES